MSGLEQLLIAVMLFAFTQMMPHPADAMELIDVKSRQVL